MDAGQLVRDHGVTAEAVRTEQNPKWGCPHHAYKVTLRRPGARAMVVPFQMGIALTQPPTAEEVLECLAGDAASIENAPSLDDWCAEFGFDPDDRHKHSVTYNQVVKQTDRLRRFLGDELFEALVNGSDEGDEEFSAYRIVMDGHGMGGFLCPPGHPNYTYTLEHLAGARGVTAQGASPIEYAFDPRADASPEIQAEARAILDAAPIKLTERWLRFVYGYFRHSYAPESLDRDVSHAITDRGNTLPAGRHPAVLMVRRYFPDHEPRLDLIADPGDGSGTTTCDKCRSRVQYEPRYDALAVVSSSGGYVEVECPEGGNHETGGPMATYVVQLRSDSGGKTDYQMVTNSPVSAVELTLQAVGASQERVLSVQKMPT